MGWADPYIPLLREGRTVQFRPRGNSMRPRIQSGQLCTVEPVSTETELRSGDVVLCKVRGAQYLHLIRATRSDGTYQIGNASGHVNGWVGRSSIYGRLVAVEP